MEKEGHQEHAEEEIEQHAETHRPNKQDEHLEGEVGKPSDQRSVVAPLAMIGDSHPACTAKEPNQGQSGGSRKKAEEGPKGVDIGENDGALQHLGEPGVEKAKV